jgi:hypothetical protein
MTEHGQALEADLLRYYGADLADIVTGRMSPRRLSSLVAGLPADSATVRATLGGDSLWGLPEHLLARILDTLAGANWQRSGGKGQRPKPVPRPGSGHRIRYGVTSASPGEVMEYLSQFQPIPEEDPGDD